MADLRSKRNTTGARWSRLQAHGLVFRQEAPRVRELDTVCNDEQSPPSRSATAALQAANYQDAMTAPAAPFCHFWALPRELRDIMYSYAYSAMIFSIKPVAFTGLLLNLDLEDLSTPCELLLNPMDSLLISKQYYAEATPAFYQRTTIHFAKGLGLQSFDLRAPTSMLRSMRKVSMDAFLDFHKYFHLLSDHCPGLSSFRLSNGDEWLDNICRGERKWMRDWRQCRARQLERPKAEALESLALLPPTLTEFEIELDMCSSCKRNRTACLWPFFAGYVEEYVLMTEKTDTARIRDMRSTAVQLRLEA